MATLYSIWITDALGNRLGLVDDFLSLDLTRSVNAVGSLTLVVRSSFPDYFLVEDNRIEVWRSVDGRSPSLVTNTSWFMRKFDKTIKGGRNTYTITAMSAVEWLQRRVVAYGSETAYANKTLPADDLIKAVVRENLGALCADGSRSIDGWLVVNGDQSLGPIITSSFARKNVFTVCQDTAQAAATVGVPVFFDVTGFGSSLRCETYVGIRGIDHSYPSSTNPVVLSPSLGNLDDCNLTRDYSDEITTAYAAGTGEAGARHVVGDIDPSRYYATPFNRREAHIDSRQSFTDEELHTEVYTALRKGRPKFILTGSIVQTPQTIYGIHWDFGDRVTATFDKQSFNCRLDTLSISVQGGKETIKAGLRSEE